MIHLGESEVARASDSSTYYELAAQASNVNAGTL